MVRAPPFWEELLKSYIGETFRTDRGKGDFNRFFATGVKELTLAFTQERGSLPKNYFNRKELRSGYILYFVPVNALKVTALLQQTEVLGKEHLKVLDIGSGPGTGVLGTFLYLENRKRPVGAQLIAPLQIEWTLVDQNRHVLHDASSLHDATLLHLKTDYPGWPIDSRLRTITADLFLENPHRFLPRERFDLILCLNTLSELPRPRRLAMVETLVRDYLSPSGRFLIMEPALRQTTRELMELHDSIVQRGSATVLAPCLHQAACPMLQANNRDWCHTTIEWERPPWIEVIDRLVGIRKDYLQCSYLLLGKGAMNGAPTTWRVVSGPLNSRGKSERLLCGPAGLPHLLRVVRLDRDRTPANEDFDRLGRGDVVEVSPASKTTRIGRETVVRKV